MTADSAGATDRDTESPRFSLVAQSFENRGIAARDESATSHKCQALWFNSSSWAKPDTMILLSWLGYNNVTCIFITSDRSGNTDKRDASMTNQKYGLRPLTQQMKAVEMY